MRRVVCTGLGAVSCFGLGVEKFWQSLVNEQSGVAPIEAFDASDYRSNLAAEIPPDLLRRKDLTELTGHPKEDATLLATLAAREAFLDAALVGVETRAFGCVVGTLCSSSRSFEQYARIFMSTPNHSTGFPDVDACNVAYQLEHIVEHFGLEGPSTLISTACSSSTDAIGCAVDFIRGGHADIMLVGGGDILSESVHAGFNSVFSITRDASRPFDTARTGFFIGEGAGMLILEELEHAVARGARIYCEVKGYGLSNSAYHLTATSNDGRGEALALERALHDSGVDAADVQYVNAHGTATSHNDLTESLALRRVFGSRNDLTITSIKPNIGHCMGASGALEAVAMIKCIEQGYIPPTLNSTGNLDPELGVLVGRGIERKIDNAISQSFGFGGASSALLVGVLRDLPPSVEPREAIADTSRSELTS